MRTTPIEDIVVPANRQRRLFDPAKLQEFGDGIAKRGLLHPIILREEKGVLVLVAGERRLRAIRDLADLGIQINHDGAAVEVGHIPYTLFTELDPLAAEEAEYEENVHRIDLSWTERAAATKRLYDLRRRQALAAGTEPPSIADTSLEVRGSAEGSNHEATRQEIILADHLHKPEIAAASSAKEAFKILKRSEAADRSRALGESVGRTFTADLHRCLNTDSLAWMKEATEGQFDVILTDPPYGMKADEFGDSGGRAAGGHGYVDSAENFWGIMTILAPESFRLAKTAAHLYLFCDVDYFTDLRFLFAKAGWEVFRTPLVWHKPSAMRAPWPMKGPQRKYELCLYAVKGDRPVLKMAPDLVTYTSDDNLGHAAQKPVDLFLDLLKRSVNPGDSVFDPFCGTGPVFPAAHEMKCKATGIELDTAHYGIAVKRIEQMKAQIELGL